MANRQTNYVQDEQLYVYNSVTQAKSYQLGYLNQTVANNGGVSANNNQGGSYINNTWVAPSAGNWALTTKTLAQLDNQTELTTGASS